MITNFATIAAPDDDDNEGNIDDHDFDDAQPSEESVKGTCMHISSKLNPYPQADNNFI